MKTYQRYSILVPSLLGSLFLLTGCVTELSQVSGYVQPAAKIIQGTAEAARPIEPSEEYYIGRAVAAKLLTAYPLMKYDYRSFQDIKNAELTEYLNLIGTTMALNSDKPSTFGGYHFAVLDVDEPNAFACPGGTIFVTKGMVKLARSEDELAAVLAHEVAHVNHQDGINAIKSSRWTGVLTLIGTTAAKEYGPRELGQLVTLFEGSIDDVFKTLVVNGYSRDQEYAADASALAYLSRSGYKPQALADFLKRLNERGSSEGGILKTHPGTLERIEKVLAAMPQTAPGFVEERQARFSAVMGSK